jgi:N-acetyl-anhydromuramyl-L-alanine amidase AmpD
MKTIKLGDKGDQVTTLQKMLNKFGYGLLEDGDFGKKTDTAVKAFQKSKGLISDGVVGEKTWNALGVKSETPTATTTTNSKCVDPSVIYAPLKSCITRTPGRSVKYIAIHYTAGGSSAPGRAIGMKNSWEKTRRASADFGVDDRDMVQFNPDILNYKCWSVGDKKNPYSGGGRLYGIATNGNTISIEVCSSLKPGTSSSKTNHEGWYFTDKVLDNAVKLTKILMKKFNVPLDRVVRHYDISGKVCPGIHGWNNAGLYNTKGEKIAGTNNSKKWEEFKERLK